MSKESINYCMKDYYHRHYWRKIGVDRGMIIYQCSQCRKCSFEEIEIVGNLKQLRKVKTKKVPIELRFKNKDGTTTSFPTTKIIKTIEKEVEQK